MRFLFEQTLKLPSVLDGKGGLKIGRFALHLHSYLKQQSGMT